MRLTINIEDDLYAMGRGLAQAEDISISQAINRLLRRSLTPSRGSPRKTRHPISGLPVSRGRRLITGADVRQAEVEDDRQ